MPTECEHKGADRESYIEGPVYTCCCGKQFTVADLINALDESTALNEGERLFIFLLLKRHLKKALKNKKSLVEKFGAEALLDESDKKIDFTLGLIEKFRKAL